MKYSVQYTKNSEEDPAILTALNSLLKERRGYMFSPPKNKPIVLIFSGGIDSSVIFHRLLNELKCVVYPLYVVRGAKAENQEKKSIEFFISFYQKRFPNLVKNIKYVDCKVPPTDLKQMITKERLNIIGHPMRNVVLQSIGIQYAVGLNETEDLGIKTVFTATSPDDFFPHSSLTALRSITVLTCLDNADWEWQVSSPLLEPSLWGEIGKSQLILYAKKHNIPLEKTHTCTSSNEISCGICPECITRVRSFKLAGLEDPLDYEYTKDA